MMNAVPADLLMASLDAVGHAMLVVSRDGNLLLANSPGKAALDEGVPVARDGSRIRGRSSGLHARLMAAIGAACDSERITSMAATTGGPGECHIVRVAPLGRGHSGEMAAILYISNLPQRETPASALQQLFALSPSESDVALLIAQGKSAKEVARARKTSELTVKSQTRGACLKAGVSGRGALIQLLCSIPLFASETQLSRDTVACTCTRAKTLSST